MHKVLEATSGNAYPRPAKCLIKSRHREYFDEAKHPNSECFKRTGPASVVLAGYMSSLKVKSPIQLKVRVGIMDSGIIGSYSGIRFKISDEV
jgi:hypothetical protein